ncbi:MAG TPA: hypothetical protein VMD92_01100 [Acidobacteriaceae bacterium]|nr:hypothetical protein [Acidobacteriaceae bacterium]
MLPVAELVVAGIVAGPLAATMLRHPPHLFRNPDGKIILDLRNPAVARWLQEGGPHFPTRFEDIYYLNVPAMLVEIGISLPTSWPESYRPAWAWPIGLDGFRALTWPIWALPFWFFAGRGIDSFTGRGQISAIEAFFMGLLGFAVAFLGLGIVLSEPSSLHPGYEAWMAAPAAMWSAFGVVCQMAWWLQRKNRRERAEQPVKV